jgi:ribokinase
MSAPRPRIAAIGLSAWDQLIVVDDYPEAGGHAMVEAEAVGPGGTTANSAVALARLGARVALASAVGDDPAGRTLRAALAAEGVDTAWLVTQANRPTDRATIIVSPQPAERTIHWHAGAQLARGDRLDIEAIFAHDLVLVDIPDVALLRFLLDLPAHTRPRTRLLGTLTYLADPDLPDAFDLALRHDAVVGSERQALAVTGTWTLSDATAALQSRMRGQNLRAAIITRGANGCRVVTERERWQIDAFSVPVVDPTGAGDAFTGGVAYGMVLRWDWQRVGRFANAMGALAIGALGAQAALPSLAAVEALLAEAPAPPAAAG